MGTNRKKFHGFSRAQRSALRTKTPQFEVKSVEKAPQPTMGNADEEPGADDRKGDLEMDQDQAEPQKDNSGGSEDTEKENLASTKRGKGHDADQDQEEVIKAKRHKAEHETKDPSGSSGEMTKEERKKKKKETKLLAKKALLDGGRPSFMISRSHPKLKLKDVRDLIVYLLTETPTLPWIMVKNKFNIHNVVVLYVSGLDPRFFNIDLADPESHKPVAWAEKAIAGPVTELQELRKFFDYMSVTQAGGDKQSIYSPTNTLLNVSLSNSERARRDAERKRASASAEKKTAEFHMLTLDELKDCDYPLPTYLSPGSELQEGWIETERPTSNLDGTPPPKKLLAMDCEMCRTSAGSELTRISVLDESGETIYDTLVIPDNPIVDYLTQYSGMTAERLEGVTTTLKVVQAELKKLVSYDNILVGHSLENDMKVLKFAHPFIIDTSKLYHHTRGPPYRASLKWLAQKWLSRSIQQGGANGHDSVEDAKTCLDLVKLKLEMGPLFGEFSQEQESIFARLDRHTTPKLSAMIDSFTFAGKAATTTIKPSSDLETVKAVQEAVATHSFVWARLRGMEINHGKVPEADATAGQLIGTGRDSAVPCSTKITASDEEIRKAARRMDAHIAQIVESLPVNTALLILSGQGDYREVSKMQQRQKNFQKLYNTLHLSQIPPEDHFLEADQVRLEEAIDQAKNGVCFLMVK
ncbi:hypothetical protein MVEG_02665 [Podila verticillata NRRL 6337]|nr:hypothetical protein MVEG_02665 [Podila verticillata NRRL 6337]